MAAPIRPPDDAARLEYRPGGESATDLAEKLQNPIGNLISILFQNNKNFNVGPHKGTQDILNIQPVVPYHLNAEWNLITRTIVRVVWSPSFQPAQSTPFGLGPTSFSAFFSPKNSVDGWIWGAGPVAQLPTITSKTLGSDVWGLCPAVVVVKLAGPIVLARWSTTSFRWEELRGAAAPATACSPSIRSSTTISAGVGLSAARRLSPRIGGRAAPMDLAGWYAGRPADQDRRQTADQPSRRRLLQCSAARIWGDLAATHPDRGHFPRQDGS
jgi:hypothetical protein